jgi:hypothetical protein
MNDGQIPNFRGVRVHVSTGYTRVDGNRRASRNGRVSDLHPNDFATFSPLYRRRLPPSRWGGPPRWLPHAPVNVRLWCGRLPAAFCTTARLRRESVRASRRRRRVHRSAETNELRARGAGGGCRDAGGLSAFTASHPSAEGACSTRFPTRRGTNGAAAATRRLRSDGRSGVIPTLGHGSAPRSYPCARREGSPWQTVVVERLDAAVASEVCAAGSLRCCAAPTHILVHAGGVLHDMLVWGSRNWAGARTAHVDVLGACVSRPRRHLRDEIVVHDHLRRLQQPGCSQREQVRWSGARAHQPHLSSPSPNTSITRYPLDTPFAWRSHIQARRSQSRNPDRVRTFPVLAWAATRTARRRCGGTRTVALPAPVQCGLWCRVLREDMVGEWGFCTFSRDKSGGYDGVA